MDRDGIVSRFTAPVTHITTNSSGKVVVSGSCDMNITVTEPETSKSYLLSGHTAPILGLALDPKTKYLASSSCDGTIRVWSLEDRKTVKMWNCLPTCNSFFLATCLGRPSWQPNSGNHLAIPDKQEVYVYARDSWENTVTFSGDRSKTPFSLAAFSTCDRFLAASTTNGDIYVWNVAQKTCISYTEHDQRRLVCSLAWNPSGIGEIAYCDVSGQLGTIDNIITSEEVAPPKQVEKHVRAEEDMSYNELLNDDDDEEDGENVISLNKIKESLTQPANLGLDLEEKSTKDDEDNDEVASIVSDVVRSVPSISIQPPFQPTSTPVHLQHRFMVWNSVGIVRAFNTEEENSLDVEFHDSSLHHALHMTNYLKHTMASLSEQALVLACEANDDTPSKVVCVLLNAWDGTREWSVDLPEDEEALAVATSDKWLAVATDTRNLRFFSLGGTQREVISLPGPVVCLAPFKDRLIVAYHNGAGLCFVLLHIKSNDLQAAVPFQPLPVSPQSTLMWLGFSDQGTPCTMDSAGMVRMFTSNGLWLSICNTKTQCKGKSDHYFVLGISERYQNIRCVLCKGSHYPPTTPRPAVAEIPIQIPLCDPMAEKSVLEGTFWKAKTIYNTLDEVSRTDSTYEGDKKAVDKLMKETIIKLFALACRSGLEHRAVDLCELMPSHQVVELAVKYASKLGKMHLASRLSEVVARKKRESEQDSQRVYMNSSLTFPSTPMVQMHNSTDIEMESSASTPRHSSTMQNEDPDPFADTPISQERENVLMAAKQKMSILSEARPSQKKLNPFKKTADPTEGHKGLDRLIACYIQGNNSKEPQTDSATPPVSGKKKQTSLKGKSPASDSKPGMTFVQWFAAEKAALQEEFPNMNATEITRLGMKRFKELNTKEKQNPLTTKENHTPNVKSKEDSCQNTKNSEQPSKQNSSPAFEKEDGTSQDQKKLEDIGETPKLGSNKRKPEDEKQHEMAKKTTTQKLSCFAFKK
ncbi:WD repeat and HMG-box DNA-binding protein 1 isoform X2 [Anabrus simplex]